MVGFSKLVLYNDGSTDNYKEILRPHIDAGYVELIEWPIMSASLSESHDWLDSEVAKETYLDDLRRCKLRHRKMRKIRPGDEENSWDENMITIRDKTADIPVPQQHGHKECQTSAYSDCYARHRDYQWVGGFDIDEFLVPPWFDPSSSITPFPSPPSTPTSSPPDGSSIPLNLSIPLVLRMFEESEGCVYMLVFASIFGTNNYETTPKGISPPNV